MASNEMERGKADMSNARQELLALLSRRETAQPIAGGTAPASDADAIARQPLGADDRAPLSFAQQRLWFLAQLEPDSPFYNLPGALRLVGDLDVAALGRTLDEIVRRHESLRTRYVAGDGDPLQQVLPPAPLPLPLTDLSSLPREEAEAAARHLIAAEAHRPFDLEHDVPVRAALIRLGPAEHILLFCMHHIASDGWSRGVLIREVGALYAAFARHEASPLAEPRIQYADFARWQRARLQAAALDAQRDYWTRQLADAPALLELPTDRPRPAVQDLRGATLAFTLDASMTRALQELARGHGATLYMVLLAAFNVLLGRYSGQRDICVGSPIANRHHPDTEGLIGFFANTLVMRTDLSGDPRFIDVLGAVRDTATAAYEHQDIPFEALVEALNPVRSMSHSPLFQVAFALQNAARDSMRLADLTLTALTGESGTSKFDLSLIVSEDGAQLNGQIEYKTGLFDAATIARLAGHLRNLLGSIISGPARRLSQLTLLDAAEYASLIHHGNDTAAAYPECPVHTLFEAQVRRTPAAMALAFEGATLSYAALNARANRLAHYLRAQGAGPDRCVGLCVDRSFDMLVGLLGILKAGAAYVPMDPSYPTARFASMLADAQPCFVLTQHALRARLPALDCPVLCLDSESATLDGWRDDDPPCTATPDNLAYVIYTSGSTGTPKGVAVQHRSVTSFCTLQAQRFGLGAEDKFLQFASLNFDGSVCEVFATLISGACLQLARVDVLHSASDLSDLTASEGVTAAIWPPALLNLIPDQPGLATLRTLISGGDVCPVEAPARWASARRSFINVYGPTETTVYAITYVCDGSERGAVPLGTPTANMRAYVLDEHLNPTPLGVPGEIYLGGVGLARGYLHRPDLTAEKFLPDPFSSAPGGRLYRTGDKGCRLANGDIAFLGRVDHQVKVRGFRIELGEIETVLGLHASVRNAYVMVTADADDRRIVAYVAGAGADAATLREHLAERLPDYMIPAAIVVLDALPMNASGKVDRDALPAPVFAQRSDLYVPPADETEERLAALWSAVLDVARVGATDNFFDLGGHSLLATQLTARVRQAFGVALPLRNLFEGPTIRQMAARLAHATAPAPTE
ncbi:MAG: amino acid adenylation domain-containing protein, partial [Rhodocyclaceae bacterium]